MNVYGPRQDYKGAYVTVIMRMYDRVRAGKSPMIHGSGEQTFDFVYVKDVARANILALKADVTDKFYNIGSGKGTTLKELAKTFLKVMGREGLGIEFKPSSDEFVTRRVGSTEMAEREIGFKAEVSLEDGLEKLIKWRMMEEG
jgi:UDP-glucose 4-epimerase